MMLTLQRASDNRFFHIDPLEIVEIGEGSQFPYVIRRGDSQRISVLADYGGANYQKVDQIKKAVEKAKLDDLRTTVVKIVRDEMTQEDGVETL